MRMNNKITIRPEEHKDYKSIISLILRSFQEGTGYSDGTDIIALVLSYAYLMKEQKLIQPKLINIT